MVINGKFIADTGSIDEIRRRWGDRATTGPVTGAPAVSRKSGLKFIYLEKGQAAYPGFHGASRSVVSLFLLIWLFRCPRSCIAMGMGQPTSSPGVANDRWYEFI